MERGNIEATNGLSAANRSASTREEGSFFSAGTVSFSQSEAYKGKYNGRFCLIPSIPARKSKVKAK